jgi:molecular chaperone GrpE
MTHEPTNGEPRHARGKTLGEARAESISTPTRTELLARIEELTRDLEQARARADENLANWQRSAADFANFKRRTDEERRASATLSNAALISRLLAVLDDFDRALDSVPADAHESWVEGIRLVERKLRGVLESEGLTAIDAVGKQFDPNLHEAVVHEDTAEHPDNVVIDELQRGYRLRDRVIRPALVRVANNPKEH